jgi:tetratricopeptide (TPR) repeat protein
MIAGAPIMDEIFKRILDKLKGVDFWIAVGFLAAGFICWRLIGTTKVEEKEVLHRQVWAALGLAAAAGSAIVIHRYFFVRKPTFTQNVTGILVMRIVGDDSLDSFQGDLIASLNANLEKEAVGQQIEVHPGTKALDETHNSVTAAHQRARTIGQRLNAQLVIWGRKSGDKKFFPRITVVAGGGAFGERTHDVQNITEVRLPEDVVDEPFYLIHSLAGYSYYAHDNYKEALPHFRAALRRKGSSVNELADLQFLVAFCDYSLAVGQKNMTVNLEEAIGLYEKAAKVYDETSNENKWARTQNNLGIAYGNLPTGDRVANLQKAIAAYEAALTVLTEKDFPVDWAMTQNNLGNAYSELPTGDRAANLQKAIAAYEAALTVRTEKDFPVEWAATQNNLGLAYSDLPTGNRAANLQKAIAACEAALRVYTEKDFPVEWAMTQNNLGLLHASVTGGNRTENMKNGKVCFEAALRVYTESGFPEDHRNAAAHLADVEHQLRNLTSE